jgi:hypothetical protein
MLVLLAGAANLAGCSAPESDTQRIQRLARKGDVEGLAHEIAKNDATVGREAVRALATLGEKAEPQVRLALGDSRAPIREAAAAAYPQVAGPKAAPDLARLARLDADPDVRAVAVTGLGRLVALDEMEALFEALEDPNALVRRRAVSAVERLVGRRYDICASGTPEERHRVVAELREEWPRIESHTRQYHEGFRPPAPR